MITLPYIILGAVGFGLIVISFLMDKRARPGEPFLISPIYVQITGAVLLIVLAAELVALLTGASWTPPFLR